MIKVIKFYANWCGPCKVYGKIFDKVTAELKDIIEVENINVEEDIKGMGAKYKVSSIPFTVVIKGDTVKQEVGRLDEEKLRKFILDE
jgi:thioredoxin 1|tara:strand:- start:713 stop:973 length:261 start_codon:yes stop_codon:yes gene_type:complete